MRSHQSRLGRFAATVVLLLLASATGASGDIDGGRYCSEEWRLCITAPANWQLTEGNSYPNILLWMVRRQPKGKMLVSAERGGPSVDSLGYANQTAKTLQGMGFTTRPPQLHAATGAYWMDFDNGSVYLRQAFVTVGDYRYSLTLSAADQRTRGLHLRSFDYALRSLSITRAASASPADKPR